MRLSTWVVAVGDVIQRLAGTVPDTVEPVHPAGTPRSSIPFLANYHFLGIG
jgi:hypothetical protein